MIEMKTIKVETTRSLRWAWEPPFDRFLSSFIDMRCRNDCFGDWTILLSLLTRELLHHLFPDQGKKRTDMTMIFRWESLRIFKEKWCAGVTRLSSSVLSHLLIHSNEFEYGNFDCINIFAVHRFRSHNNILTANRRFASIFISIY